MVMSRAFPPYFRIGEGKWYWNKRQEREGVIEEWTDGGEPFDPPHVRINRGRWVLE